MTDRKNYNKLVRDRIPEIIAAEGRQCSTEIMSDDEYRRALLAKLVEEAQEVAATDRSHASQVTPTGMRHGSHRGLFIFE